MAPGPQNVELSSDIVEHIGIGLRAPRPFGGMVQVREQVVMKRDDAGKEHPRSDSNDQALMP